MSTKSSHGSPKNVFTGKMMIMAAVMLVVFVTIIVAYPRIFSPSNIGSSTNATPNTAPAPHP